MSAKREFVDAARAGKVMAKKCSRCGMVQLGTVRFCRGCGSRGFEEKLLEGRGTVETYTIITVPPTGFEKHAPYAWVVMRLAGRDLRISGFMAGISRPEDLPVGCGAEIAGFDERGILVKRV